MENNLHEIIRLFANFMYIKSKILFLRYVDLFLIYIKYI